MEFFRQEGSFWLPRRRDRMVHGSVSFEESGITLELAFSLRGPIQRAGGGFGGSPAPAIEPVVHGYLRDGREVTLWQLSGLSWPVEGVRETWRADFLFCGGLISQDRFVSVQMTFDHLMAWAQPPGIAEQDGAHDRVAIDTRRKILDRADLPGRMTVKLCTGIEGRSDHASVHYEQWIALEVTGLARNAKTIRCVLDDWVRPLQDLLVLSLGRPVRIGHLAVRPRGQSAPLPLLDVACQLVQPRLVVPPQAADVENYTAPTLLTYRDSLVPYEQLIPAWFGLRERLPDVITDLCGPFYAPFIYSGHRYASTFQSAEALAHGLFSSKEMNRPDHQMRVAAVTKALEVADLDQEYLGWATRVLRSRNDKPLRRFIEELVAGTGEIGRLLTRAAPDLAQEAATARAGVSHPGAGGPGVFRRYWLGEALIWVVRVHVLAQLGIPMEYLERRVVQMTAFKSVLGGLKSGDVSLRPARRPGFSHGTCPVNHRTLESAARCKNNLRF
jgi:hypothetical protein